MTRVLRRPPQWTLVLAGMVVLLLVLPPLTKGSVTSGSVYNLLQTFAQTAPIALALGLMLIAGEFDLSVVASYFLGAMLTVKVAGDSIVLGALLAGAAGAFAGAVQGFLVARFAISSIPVTLGGFILLWGLTNVLGNGQVVGYTHFEVTQRLIEPVATIFSLWSLIVVAAFAAAALLFALTRVGRHLRAIGGDRRASRTAGVRVNQVLIGAFAFSGAIAGLGGALSGLASASALPDIGFQPLSLAVIAVVVGGVAVTGGQGSVVGIGAGVLSLAILQEALAIAGAGDDVRSLVTGTFLLVVALVAAPRIEQARPVVALDGAYRRRVAAQRA